MSVRKRIWEPNGVYSITFTCARWLELYKITNGYDTVYHWFDYLKAKGNHIVAYVIMPSHVHAIIGFCTSTTPINNIIGNGKRFMAYELVKLLRSQGKEELLEQMKGWVNSTDEMRHKQHEVFEPSFDWKECFDMRFIEQKAANIHMNPCKAGMVKLPEEYVHSSAKYYYTGEQGIYPVITYIEFQDIDLT